jgi:hypothetical protein
MREVLTLVYLPLDCPDDMQQHLGRLPYTDGLQIQLVTIDMQELFKCIMARDYAV